MKTIQTTWDATAVPLGDIIAGETPGSYERELSHWAEVAGLNLRDGDGDPLFNLHIEVLKSASEDTENGGSLGTDGDDLLITGMRIDSFARPGTPRRSRHLRTLAHEFAHYYVGPFEGYGLLSWIDFGGGLSWDWRETNNDTGGIFRRNPGLRDCPTVDTQSDFIEATISPFLRELIERDIRFHRDWSRLGWGSEVEVQCGGKHYSLGWTEETRFLPWRPTGQVFDIHEFLLAELRTGRREIIPYAPPIVIESPEPEPSPESEAPKGPVGSNPIPPPMVPTNTTTSGPGGVNVVATLPGTSDARDLDGMRCRIIGTENDVVAMYSLIADLSRRVTKLEGNL